MIPYNKQSINRKDINSVSKSLTEKLITTGPTNQKFENLIKKKFQCKFASIVSSGTAALHLSFLSGVMSRQKRLFPTITKSN